MQGREAQESREWGYTRHPSPMSTGFIPSGLDNILTLWEPPVPSTEVQEQTKYK